MRLKHYLTLLLSMTLILSTHIVNAEDKLAIRNFQSALNACDRGLQMGMPKSPSSLRILKSQLKRYKRNRDRALTKDPSIKDSTIHTFSGNFLDEKTFSEAFLYCETALLEKVQQAEEKIAEQVEIRKQRQEQRRIVLEKLMTQIKAAKQHLAIAINQYCINYSRTPTGNIETIYQNYQAEKEKALAAHPNIIKHFYEVTIYDEEFGEEEVRNKTVNYWFEYCEEIFAEGLQDSMPKPEEITTVTIENADAVEQVTQIEQEETVTMPADNEQGPTLPEEVATVEESDNLPVDKDENAVIEEKEVAEKIEPATKAEADSKEDMPSEEELPAEDENVEEDYNAELEEEYQALLDTAKDGRLEVLKLEQRLPDFVSDEDFDYIKSDQWMYENDNKCKIYEFNSETLVKTQENTGECI